MQHCAELSIPLCYRNNASDFHQIYTRPSLKYTFMCPIYVENEVQYNDENEC